MLRLIARFARGMERGEQQKSSASANNRWFSRRREEVEGADGADLFVTPPSEPHVGREVAFCLPYDSVFSNKMLGRERQRRQAVSILSRAKSAPVRQHC